MNRIRRITRAPVLSHDAFVDEARAVELDALLDARLAAIPRRLRRPYEGRRRVAGRP